MYYYTIQNNVLLKAENKEALAVYGNVQVLPSDYEQGKYIVVNGELIVNPNYEEEQTEARKNQFNKDFFQTSLGYIRRKVTMKTGETKDFLSDLLPVISMGVESGQEVTIIAYKKPDFTQEITDWKTLQEKVIVNATFIQECFNRLSVDFTG